MDNQELKILNEKVYNMFYIGLGLFSDNLEKQDFNNRSYYVNYLSLNRAIFNSNYDNVQKVDLLLHKLKTHDLTIKKEDISIPNMDSVEDVVIWNSEIDLSEFNELAKKTFNVTFTQNDMVGLEKTGHCPNYTFDAKNEKFYIVAAGCGGTGGSGLNYYIEKYEKNNDEIIADIYVGYQTEMSSKCYLFKKYRDDLNIADAYKELGELCTGNDDEINSQNYMNFEKYNMIFKKDQNGNYYFESMNLVK